MKWGASFLLGGFQWYITAYTTIFFLFLHFSLRVSSVTKVTCDLQIKGQRLEVWDWHEHSAIFKIDNENKPTVRGRKEGKKEKQFSKKHWKQPKRPMRKVREASENEIQKSFLWRMLILALLEGLMIHHRLESFYHWN